MSALLQTERKHNKTKEIKKKKKKFGFLCTNIEIYKVQKK